MGWSVVLACLLFEEVPGPSDTMTSAGVEGKDLPCSVLGDAQDCSPGTREQELWRGGGTHRVGFLFKVSLDLCRHLPTRWGPWVCKVASLLSLSSSLAGALGLAQSTSRLLWRGHGRGSPGRDVGRVFGMGVLAAVSSARTWKGSQRELCPALTLAP